MVMEEVSTSPLILTDEEAGAGLEIGSLAAFYFSQEEFHVQGPHLSPSSSVHYSLLCSLLYRREGV